MKSIGKEMALNAAQDAKGGEASAPSWIHLVPAGEFWGRDGRGPWRLSEPEAVLAATKAHQAGADLPLDYEHQSEMAGENGQPAPAAGWIVGFETRPDGLWGRVEWTERGRNLVAAREYRYISPVFEHDKGGNVLRLISAALVAQPNLRLKALNKEGTTTMEEFLKQLALLLGLAETASQEEIFAAVQKLKDEAAADGADAAVNDEGADDAAPEGEPPLDEAEAALLEAVSDLIGAAEEASNKKLGGFAAKKANSARNVQRADAAGGLARVASAFKAMNQMGARLADLEVELARNKAERVVSAAMKAGKVTPALREWAMNYAAADPQGFADYLKTAPAILQNGGGFASINSGAGALGAEEKAVCKQLGLSEADFLKAKKENAHG